MAAILEKPLNAPRRYAGRLAPSPTGALHLGNVRTFMIAWLRARSQGGRVVMRMDDLDHPRDKPGADVQAVEDLKWLGFDWDESHVQSGRKDLYREALEAIRGSVYPCTCSRRDVEAAQSAPHSGEQLRYPGTCRGRHAEFPPGACWRFRVDEGTVVSFNDAFAGPFSQDVAAVLGDFPVSRDAGGAGYTLACVVDDVLMGVSEVVRGDDLLAATPAQIVLAGALAPWFAGKTGGFRPPSYCHVPLVVGPDGRRLAKRHGDTRVSTFREAGFGADEIIGFLAETCGWAERGERISLAALLPRFNLATLPHEPFVFRGLPDAAGRLRTAP